MIIKLSKKIFLAVILLLAPYLTLAITIENPVSATTFEELINTVLNFIFWVAIAIVPIMIIVAAYFFLTSGGDPAKVGQAKKVLLYTLIGLFIVLSGRGIASIIESFFGGGGGGSVCTPTVPPCNGSCPAGCTVAQDPDCDCQNGDGCCGIGCNNAADNDCPLVCTPDGCNGNCPAGCTVAQDSDCPPCQGGNACCGIGCNNATDNDCPAGGLTQTELTELGDISGPIAGVPNCAIEMKDVGRINLAFGPADGTPSWDYQADINEDGQVDMQDLNFVVNTVWGWTCH